MECDENGIVTIYFHISVENVSTTFIYFREIEIIATKKFSPVSSFLRSENRPTRISLVRTILPARWDSMEGSPNLWMGSRGSRRRSWGNEEKLIFLERERDFRRRFIGREGCTNGEGNWSKGRIVRGVDNEHLKIGKNWEAISSGIKRSFGGRICRRLLFFEKFRNIFRINVFATLRRRRLLFLLTRSRLILEREKKS